jgi:beta-phosphoglucomutase
MLNLKTLKISDYKCLLFDFDGTLVNSREANFQAYRSAANDFDLKLERNKFFEHWGKDALEFLPSIFPTLTSREIEQIRKNKPVYFEGYLELVILNTELFKLITNGAIEHKIALVTTAKKASIELIFNKFNLAKWFDVLITGDEHIQPKPSPAPYLLALDRLSCAAHEAVAFEDSEVGIRSAQSAQIDVVKIDFQP